MRAFTDFAGLMALVYAGAVNAEGPASVAGRNQVDRGPGLRRLPRGSGRGDAGAVSAACWTTPGAEPWMAEGLCDGRAAPRGDGSGGRQAQRERHEGGERVHRG